MDKKSVELIQRGDRKTIEYIYLRYYKLVKYKAYEMVKNNEDADEITQDVFVKVFKKIDSYDTKQNFVTWLLTITKNTAIDYLKLKIFDTECIEDFSNVSDNAKETNKCDLDDKIKSLLTDEEYMIVIHKIYFELKFSEIAKILNSNLASVTGKYYRAINKFQTIFEILFWPTITLLSHDKGIVISFCQFEKEI